MTRRQAKAMRRCGGVRLSNPTKVAAKFYDLGYDNSTIMEYRRMVANGNVPGHTCDRAWKRRVARTMTVVNAPLGGEPVFMVSEEMERWLGERSSLADLVRGH